MPRAKLKGITLANQNPAYDRTAIGEIDMLVARPLILAGIRSDEQFFGLTRKDVLNKIRRFKSKEQALEEINRVRRKFGADPI